jgi:hypothetical protein
MQFCFCFIYAGNINTQVGVKLLSYSRLVRSFLSQLPGLKRCRTDPDRHRWLSMRDRLVAASANVSFSTRVSIKYLPPTLRYGWRSHANKR